MNNLNTTSLPKVGMTINVVDQSAIIPRAGENIVPVSNILSASATPTGPEKLTYYKDIEEFRQTHYQNGTNFPYTRYGLPLYGTDEILESGSGVYFKRICADDATLANATLIASVNRVQKQEVDANGNPLYIAPNGDRTTESETTILNPNYDPDAIAPGTPEFDVENLDETGNYTGGDTLTIKSDMDLDPVDDVDGFSITPVVQRFNVAIPTVLKAQVTVDNPKDIVLTLSRPITIDDGSFEVNYIKGQVDIIATESRRPLKSKMNILTVKSPKDLTMPLIIRDAATYDRDKLITITADEKLAPVTNVKGFKLVGTTGKEIPLTAKVEEAEPTIIKLELATPILRGDTYKIAYTSGAIAITDKSGNKLQNSDDLDTIVFASTDLDVPVITSASYDKYKTVTLLANEDLNIATGLTGFTINGPSAVKIDKVEVIGSARNKVTITLQERILTDGDYVIVYTGTSVEDAAGNKLPANPKIGEFNYSKVGTSPTLTGVSINSPTNGTITVSVSEFVELQGAVEGQIDGFEVTGTKIVTPIVLESVNIDPDDHNKINLKLKNQILEADTYKVSYTRGSVYIVDKLNKNPIDTNLSVGEFTLTVAEFSATVTNNLTYDRFELELSEFVNAKIPGSSIDGFILTPSSPTGTNITVSDAQLIGKKIVLNTDPITDNDTYTIKYVKGANTLTSASGIVVGSNDAIATVVVYVPPITKTTVEEITETFDFEFEKNLTYTGDINALITVERDTTPVTPKSITIANNKLTIVFNDFEMKPGIYKIKCTVDENNTLTHDTEALQSWLYTVEVKKKDLLITSINNQTWSSTYTRFKFNQKVRFKNSSGQVLADGQNGTIMFPHGSVPFGRANDIQYIYAMNYSEFRSSFDYTDYTVWNLWNGSYTNGDIYTPGTGYTMEAALTDETQAYYMEKPQATTFNIKNTEGIVPPTGDDVNIFDEFITIKHELATYDVANVKYDVKYTNDSDGLEDLKFKMESIYVGADDELDNPDAYALDDLPSVELPTTDVVVDNENDIIVTDRTYVFPLMSITERGRGESIKRFRLLPDYTQSKNRDYFVYRLQVISGGTILRESTFSLDTNMQGSRYNRTAQTIFQDDIHVDVVNYDEYTDEFFNMLSAITGVDRLSIAKDYCVIDGNTKKNVKFKNIDIDKTGFNLKHVYGLPLQGGSNGEFGNNDNQELMLNEKYIDKLESFYNGDLDDTVWDKYSVPFNFIIDFAYPNRVKRAIEKMVSFAPEYRNDAVAILDMGMTLTELTDIAVERELYASQPTTCIYYQSGDIKNKFTAKTIRTTLPMLIGKKLNEHYTMNTKNKPFVGYRFNFLFPELRNINHMPKVMPKVNEKQTLSNVQINFGAMQDGVFTLETAFSSQENHTQLSYINNTIAIQEVMQYLLKKSPKYRYQTMSGKEFEELKQQYNDDCDKFKDNFKRLSFFYVGTEDDELHKTFNGALEVECHDFNMSEVFTIYVYNRTEDGGAQLQV